MNKQLTGRGSLVTKDERSGMDMNFPTALSCNPPTSQLVPDPSTRSFVSYE